MKRIILWLFFPIIAQAQSIPAVLKQGQEVFSRTCSNGYCHGPSGAGGGAPRIAARGFGCDGDIAY